jgi:hypothetical protein
MLFHLAYVIECHGNYQEALGIHSDFISQQAQDLDLTLVIMKAAVLLTHLGSTNYPQAIEYLEFLLDDPPESEGYGRTHVLAMLASLYEKSGDHYAVVLEQTFAQLQESYSKDLDKGKTPVTNQKKMQSMITKRAFSKSSDIWEILAVQALDRCDLVMAILMMKQVRLEACASALTPTHRRFYHYHYCISLIHDWPCTPGFRESSIQGYPIAHLGRATLPGGGDARMHQNRGEGFPAQC